MLDPKAEALARVASAYNGLLAAQEAARGLAEAFGSVCREAYPLANDREMAEATGAEGFSRARVQQYRKGTRRKDV